jgi:hypothetical protein
MTSKVNQEMTSDEIPSGNLISVHAVEAGTKSTSEQVPEEDSGNGGDKAVATNTTTVQEATTLSVAPNESVPAPAVATNTTAVQEATTLSAAPNESVPAPVITKGDTAVPEFVQLTGDGADEGASVVSMPPLTVPLNAEAASDSLRSQLDAESSTVASAPAAITVYADAGSAASLDDIITSPHGNNAIAERSPGERYVRFMEKLGSGASKDVYRAYDTQEGIEVAWNVVHLAGVPKNERNRIFNEVRLL